MKSSPSSMMEPGAPELSSGSTIHYLRSRHQLKRVTSVWRPLTSPVVDSPLGLCDYRTVVDEDRLASDHVSSTSAVEVFQLKYSKNHKWYYLSQQTVHEPCIFVAFDSHPPQGEINC